MIAIYSVWYLTIKLYSMRRCEMEWQNTRTTMTHLIRLYIFVCFTFTRFITCLRQRELGNYNAMHPVFYVILLKSLKVVHRRGFPQANLNGYVTGLALNAVDYQCGYIVKLPDSEEV